VPSRHPRETIDDRAKKSTAVVQKSHDAVTAIDGERSNRLN